MMRVVRCAQFFRNALRPALLHRPAVQALKCRQLADVPEREGPVKYSTSPAFKLDPKETFYRDHSHILWFEPYVILASLSIFCIYFFILREENDIDSRLGGIEIEAEERRYEVRKLIKRLESCEEKGIKDLESEGKLMKLYLENKKQVE